MHTEVIPEQTKCAGRQLGPLRPGSQGKGRWATPSGSSVLQELH